MAAFATPADVAQRLGRDLTSAEANRVNALLDEASALAAAWCNEIPDPTPPAVTIAVSRMVARALVSTAEPGVTNTQAVMGPFSITRTFTPDATASVWLGRQDKMLLRPYAVPRTANIATA